MLEWRIFLPRNFERERGAPLNITHEERHGHAKTEYEHECLSTWVVTRGDVAYDRARRALNRCFGTPKAASHRHPEPKGNDACLANKKSIRRPMQRIACMMGCH